MRDGANEHLLEVKNLRTGFPNGGGMVVPVDGVSFYVEQGETLAIVGESGCGKSVTSMSILGLIHKQNGKVLSGEILYEGKDLLRCTEREICRIRGKEIAMIFQEPMTSLNPLFTVKEQIQEAIKLHRKMEREELDRRVLQLLELVEIPSARERMDQYPHELSGGMRQRVMIAMALACDPKLLIADEPTTALDVTIQAQILDLINRLKDELGMSVMLITHDLGVVAETAQRVMVMYAGTVVECTDVRELFYRPKHPYTKGLLRSLPSLDTDQEELPTIRGTVPDLSRLHQGCRFAPRCDMAREVCRQREPDTYGPKDHRVKCFCYSEEWGNKDG